MSYFQPASEREINPALRVAAWGLKAAGKTTFAVGNGDRVAHWPLPIYYFNYDMSIDELLSKIDPEVRKQIYIVDLVANQMPVTDAYADQLLKKAEAAAKEAVAAIQESGQGTIVFDTMTAHWVYIQQVELAGAKTNKDGKPYQYEYAAANRRFASLVTWLSGIPGLNLLLLHHAKPVYDEKGMATGFYEAIDNPHTEKLMPYVLQVWSGKGDDGAPTHGVTLNYVRTDKTMEGLSLPDIDYVALKALLQGEGD
ncbi:MAG: AAA family ATPase [Gammaproteobacteria bacterium]